ncbi:hypothetical protein ACHAWC_005163 [Mediolabrus comicus]
MVAEATAPPAEEIVASGSGPKASVPTPIDVVGEKETIESRDNVDTPPAHMTPSTARQEFLFSPEMPAVKEAKTNETESSAPVEETEEGATAEEPAAEEPVAEETAAPAAEDENELVEKEEEQPVEEKPGVIASLIDKAAGLCCAGEENCANQVTEIVTIAADGAKSIKQDLTCQNDDLNMVLTEETVTYDAGQSKTVESVVTDEEPEEQPEEPKEEESAPVAEAPKPSKMSMKKKFSKKLKGMKKVISFKTSKPKVVTKTEE